MVMADNVGIKGEAFGASYSYSNIENKHDEWLIKLFESDDGIHFKFLTQWPILQYPNETTLQFLDDDRMLALVRRDDPMDNKAWMGISAPPYTDWKWHPTHGYLGSQTLLF